MTQVLPIEGSTTLDDVASAIRAAPSVLGVEDTAELRAVLVPLSEGASISYASVLRIGWPSDLNAEPVVREAGGITLVATCFVASDLLGKQDLIGWLSAWRPFAHLDSPLDFPDNVNIIRHRSRSDWAVEPTWSFDLQEKTSSQFSSRPRSGPFLHAESGFFAEDIGDAARQWLRDPRLTGNGTPGTHAIVIRDRRAWLKDLKIDIDRRELSVTVERTTRAPVFLTVVTKELDQRKAVTTQELQDSSALIPVPLPLTEIRVYLTDHIGIAYDNYSESSQYVPQGQVSILNPPPAIDPEYQELRDALDAGESETVEFKAWLPLDREKPKSLELLQAATAFANASGGVIYVGVTDDCEVVGTAQKLRREFANATATTSDDLQSGYAHAVRRLLNEGISPAPAHTVSWITHAGLPVLRIQILSKGALHYVVENRTTYIRRAASNKKATASEIEAFVAQRSFKRAGPLTFLSPME